MDRNGLVNSWDRFLWQKEYVKNYREPFKLHIQGQYPPTLITDQILPGLMYLRLASILDDVLSFYIDSKNLQKPKNFRNDLKSKIDFLNNLGILKDPQSLHKIREKRNKLAHSNTGRITWNEVEPDIDITHNEFQNMNFVDDKPIYKFFSERSKLQKSNDPDILGVYNYSIGVKLNGNIKAMQSWSERIPIKK